jgi:hypothetical protein
MSKLTLEYLSERETFQADIAQKTEMCIFLDTLERMQSPELTCSEIDKFRVDVL